MTNPPENLIRCEAAVVVLGHRMDGDGVPDGIGLARLAVAADKMRNESVAVLVTTGWAYRDDIELSLADAMADAAVNIHAVADEKIVRLHDARDTVGDAVYFARAIRADSVLVITSDYHVARARRIFRFVLGDHVSLDVLGAGVGTDTEKTASEAVSLAAFEETFHGLEPGDLEAIFQRMMSAHPFYNGSTDAKRARRHD